MCPSYYYETGLVETQALGYITYNSCVRTVHVGVQPLHIIYPSAWVAQKYYGDNKEGLFSSFIASNDQNKFWESTPNRRQFKLL